MADGPQVAVVVPVFEPGPSLRDALTSVIAQTFENWELVVVDDGSVQDVEWAAAMDARISVVRATHAGVSSARNRGVEETSAPWIAFLDDDDTWSAEKLQRQLAATTTVPCDSVFCHTAFEWVHVVDGGGPPKAQIRRYPVPLTYSALLRGDHVCTSSVMLERSTFRRIGGFRSDLSHAEDLDLWLRLLRSGVRSSVVDEPLVRYTTHPSGASNDYEQTYRARSTLLREHLRRARADGDREIAHAARHGLTRGRELAAYQAFDAARASRTRAQALAHLTRSLTRDPRVVGGAVVHRLTHHGQEKP